MSNFMGERPSDVPRWAWIAVHVFLVVFFAALAVDVLLLIYIILAS